MAILDVPFVFKFVGLLIDTIKKYSIVFILHKWRLTVLQQHWFHLIHEFNSKECYKILATRKCSRPFPNYAPLLTNKTFKSRLSANFSYICCTFSTWLRLDVSVCRQWSVIRKWPIIFKFHELTLA